MTKKTTTTPLLETIRAWYQSQTRAIKGDFLRKTGLTPYTVRTAIFHGRCTDRSAKAIAAAFGRSARWPELVQ